MNMALRWTWKPFSELSRGDLHSILQLRQDVFVVEQACCYRDIDGRDELAIHLLGTDSDNRLVAYCRVFPPAAFEPPASIGRVLTAQHARGQGLGHELMRRAVTWCLQHYPDVDIRIGAQAHLQQFYSAHGFVNRGDEYPIDNIPHVDMFRSCDASS